MNDLDNGSVSAPLQEPTPTADLEKKDDAALKALADDEKRIAQATGEPTAEPDFVLPEKFKDVNSLIKSYQELEKKLGSQNNNLDIAKTEPTKEPESPKETEQSLIDKMTQKYLENGNALDDTDYAELKKAGFDKNIVDTYIAGKQYAAAQYEQNVLKDIVPDKSAYDEMLKWGTENYSDAELDAYNSMVNSGNVTQARMAVENLKNRYTANNPTNPTPTTITGTSGNATGVYQSWAEVTTDMSNPKYKNDPAFQAQVQQKIFNSKNLG